MLVADFKTRKNDVSRSLKVLAQCRDCFWFFSRSREAHEFTVFRRDVALTRSLASARKLPVDLRAVSHRLGEADQARSVASGAQRVMEGGVRFAPLITRPANVGVGQGSALKNVVGRNDRSFPSGVTVPNAFRQGEAFQTDSQIGQVDEVFGGNADNFEPLVGRELSQTLFGEPNECLAENRHADVEAFCQWREFERTAGEQPTVDDVTAQIDEDALGQRLTGRGCGHAPTVAFMKDLPIIENSEEGRK